MATEPSTDL